MARKESIAMAEGRKAFRDHLSLANNPYFKDEQTQRDAWVRGWIEAQQDSEIAEVWASRRPRE